MSSWADLSTRRAAVRTHQQPRLIAFPLASGAHRLDNAVIAGLSIPANKRSPGRPVLSAGAIFCLNLPGCKK
jgi:hypothetical protein